LWRDRELVNFASGGRTWHEIGDRAYASALRKKNRELWTASGFDRTPYRREVKVFLSSQESLALKIRMATLSFRESHPVRWALEARGTAEERSAIDRIESAELRQLVEAALSVPEAHGPYQLVEHFSFPIEQYLLLLFRSGRLAATGNLPNEILPVEILPAHWASFKIAISDDTRRLGVWRIGRTANRSVVLARKALHPGAGDIENVRVQRNGILKEFPERTPRAQNLHEVKPLSDDAARELIWEAASKKHGFITQNEGEIILRTRDPSMKRDDARRIVKSVIGNEKRGPRGPRNNSAK
jgi:hypothetical protein